MSRPLSIDHEARILMCHDAHGFAVTAALGAYPGPNDRMVRRSELEAAARKSGEPIQVFIAWLHRLITDQSVRPLNADLEFRWPSRPDPYGSHRAICRRAHFSGTGAAMPARLSTIPSSITFRAEIHRRRTSTGV